MGGERKHCCVAAGQDSKEEESAAERVNNDYQASTTLESEEFENLTKVHVFFSAIFAACLLRGGRGGAVKEEGLVEKQTDAAQELIVLLLA